MNILNNDGIKKFRKRWKI